MIHLIYIYFIVNSFLFGKSIGKYDKSDQLHFALFGTIMVILALLIGLFSRIKFLDKLYFYFELHVLGSYEELYYNRNQLNILSRSIAKEHLYQIDAIKKKYDKDKKY